MATNKKTNLIFICFFILITFFSCKLYVQPERNPITEKLDSLLSEYTFLYKFSGIVNVMSKGEEVFNKSFYESNNIGKPEDFDFTKDTQFMIGSLTKQMTAMCILILQEQGKISVDDYISHYIPNFPKGDEVTIFDLLTHTSGISREPFYDYMIKTFDKSFMDEYVNPIITDPSDHKYIFNEYIFNEKTNQYVMKRTTNDKKKEKIFDFLFTSCYIMDLLYPTPSDLLFDLLKNKAIQYTAQPGESFNYSNFGYIVLGQIIEKITKKSLPDFMEETLFIPLEMTRTGFNYDLTTDFAPAITEYYDIISRPVNMETWPGAAGGLHSTINDLNKWIEFLNDSRIISVNTKALLWGQFYDLDSSSYGYGMFRSEKKINKKDIIDINHNGYIMSYNSSIHIIPRKKVSIIILSNDIRSSYGQEKWIDDMLSVILK